MTSEEKPFLVFSHGGVGSKQLVKWLYPDADGSTWALSHRHDAFSPKGAPPGSKVIYVFGDPRNAVISVFQRRESRHDRHGFSASPTVGRDKPASHFAVAHALNLGVDPGPMNEEWGLQDFVKEGCDIFGFEAHVHNWLSVDVDYPILFIRYETFWEQMPLIADRLDIQRPPVPFLPRRADWRAEPSAVQEGLNRIYRQLCDQLARLPDVFVLQDGRRFP